ncbi:MAG TPA: hypothetical protein VMT35_02900 [Ignavibacteriaceae bacterium]|nr:hypothetical protein [Ignavibacteriaceae bacterium]
MLPKLTVKANIIISVSILLLGVILMLYGFVSSNSLMITVGIPITLVTSMLITIQNTVIK